MKKHILWISIVLSLIFFTGQGICQQSEDFNKPPTKDRIEKIRKKIETLKLWRLIKDLDLNEATASKLFPLINEYDKKRLTVEHDMRKDMKKLRESVNTASDNEIRDMVKKLQGLHSRLQEINDEELKKLSNILTDRELAKYIIFKTDFDREMKNIIAEIRHKRGAGLKNKSMMKPGEEPFMEGTETPSP